MDLMIAKFVLVAGAIGVAGSLAGCSLSGSDPTVFSQSREAIQAKLMEAQTALPRRDGSGQIAVWGVARSSKGVTLSMRYSSSAPLLRCEAVITALAPDRSRVVPDCGDSKNGDAISRTEAELHTPMFEEHIQATLNKRPFNRATVERKKGAIVMSNLGAMQREGLRRADEAQRMEAEFRR